MALSELSNKVVTTYRNEFMIIKKLFRFLIKSQSINRINMALSRAAATSALRQIDVSIPNSWEFSGFSQNGEDGIIDFLLGKLKRRSRYFIEIGTADGIECNTAWLAIAKKYSGIMIEGNAKVCAQSATLYQGLNLGVECINMFITQETVSQLGQLALDNRPDVLSLDIDGNDYYIAKMLFEVGFRPKIFVVEYNSAYGDEKKITIAYRGDFDFTTAHASQLYYGVSISGWKSLFRKYGYKFVAVDSNGVNAFFVNPDDFEGKFLDNLQGLDFRENFYQMRKFKVPWEKQFEMIKEKKFVEIE